MRLRFFSYVFLLLFLPAISLATTVNTSLSVDVSGSMSGKKIEEAKKAASVYVDFLKMVIMFLLIIFLIMPK
ncbi:MAG: hypothetical protein QXN68_02625 [Thermoplasmata archaeon]